MTKERIELSDFDWGKLDGFLEYGATKKVAAAAIFVSEDTLERRIKEKFGLTFGEYRAEKSAVMALRLKQAIITNALKGNVVAQIFALKNVAGWTDKVDNVHSIDEDTKKTIRLAYAIPEKQVRVVENEQE